MPVMHQVILISDDEVQPFLPNVVESEQNKAPAAAKLRTAQANSSSCGSQFNRIYGYTNP